MKIIVSFIILFSQTTMAIDFDESCEIKYTKDRFDRNISAKINNKSYYVEEGEDHFKVNLYRLQRKCIMNTIQERESNNNDKCAPKTAFDHNFEVIKYQFEIDGIRVSNQLRPNVLAKIIKICKKGF